MILFHRLFLVARYEFLLVVRSFLFWVLAVLAFAAVFYMRVAPFEAYILSFLPYMNAFCLNLSLPLWQSLS